MRARYYFPLSQDCVGGISYPPDIIDAALRICLYKTLSRIILSHLLAEIINETA